MSSQSTLIIQAIGLGKRVPTPTGELTILADINLEVTSGTTLAIIGASGSGKSTLLGLLAGLDTATEGVVKLSGTDLSRLDEDGRAAIRAGKVGFVFQSFQLLASLTALENVMLPLELGNHHAPREQATHILERVNLDHRLDHYPVQLSGGEQQRVAIARAFATNPQVLFADEPTGNLDSRTGQQVGDLLFELNREHNTTLVLVTHDSTLADPCDTRIELDAGRLRQSMS